MAEIEFKTSPIGNDYDVQWKSALGAGVNGEVVICVDKNTGVKYAMKCLKHRMESVREINLQWQCREHPNIVKPVAAYDNSIDRGEKGRAPVRMYLVVFEMMTGGELFDRIAAKRKFNEQEASAVIRQVASALHYLHRKNIAHRDLKPENLLYTSSAEDAHLKIADFGFAKVDKGDLVTPIYTPYYVPKEILEAQDHMAAKRSGLIPQSQVYAYDKSCDMWSLGVVLYILLCGYPPFQSEIQGQQLSAEMKRKIDEAKEVVKALLHANGSERITADALLKVPWVAGHEGISTTPLSTQEGLREKNQARAEAQKQYEDYLNQMRRAEAGVVNTGGASAKELMDKKRSEKKKLGGGLLNRMVHKSPKVTVQETSQSGQAAFVSASSKELGEFASFCKSQSSGGTVSGATLDIFAEKALAALEKELVDFKAVVAKARGGAKGFSDSTDLTQLSAGLKGLCKDVNRQETIQNTDL